ncbi:MAG: hypothetical protein ACK5XN_12525 [Bacteroidota bacterium]|jgi:hypothetical protein
MKSNSLLLLFALLAIACEVRSQANLSVQGSIQNSSGAALADGKYSVAFRLYESEIGGVPVWSETHPELEVSGGLYSVTLGVITPLTAAFDKPYFLGVSVQNTPELLPRARLSSSPYALSLIGQDNVFPSAGAIGVGTKTPDPGSQIHLKTSNGSTTEVRIESSENPEIIFKKGSNTAKITYDGNKINISDFNLVFSEGVNLPTGKTIIYDAIADWRLVDTDDFATDNDGWVCHKQWSNTTPSTLQRFSPNTPFSKGYILRPSADPGAVLKKEFDLTGIPHSMVKVVFTCHMFDDWELEEFAFAAFATQAAPYTGQAGQSNGIFQIGWRRYNNIFSPNGMGYTNFLPNEGDRNIRGSMVAHTTLDKFWIIVGSNLSEIPSNESFGLSNVEIWVK